MYHFLPVKMANNKENSSVGGEMENRAPLLTVGGSVKWCSGYGKHLEVPQSLKCRAAL